METLKPSADVPSQSKAWRIYHVLLQRYAEQFTQQEVATNLAFSTRQLGRLEKQAVRVLSDYLWCRHGVASHLTQPWGSSWHGATTTSLTSGGTPSREQELRWLKTSCPSQAADAAEIVEAALKVAAPLAQTLNVRTRYTAPPNLPRLGVHLTAVRQALLNLLTAAIRSVPGGEVVVETQLRPPQVWVYVRALSKRQAVPSPGAENPGESVEVARELVELSGGSVELLPGSDRRAPFATRIVLPAIDQVSVLVIDDNVDTLQLLERYLAGSRYRFFGTPDPQHASTLAEEVRPDVIVLDVMLPGVDGWELLGRLREHPGLRGVPILVCTVLPQEELAAALGAAGLIRKPVTQEAFLSALDRRFERLARGSG